MPSPLPTMTSVPSALTTMTSVPSLSVEYQPDPIDYDYDKVTPPPYDIKYDKPPLCIDQAWCVTVVVINVIIFLLGILGNGVVMWVIGFKMKKKSVITMWYLSLAISDFIFCATLPFNITLTATGFWIFGRFMCKFASFVLFLNMFSSIFLMVLISADRCVSVIYAVWAQNNRTLKKAGVAVAVAWVCSMLLSIPAVVIREVTDVTDSNDTSNNAKVQCYNDFTLLPSSETSLPVIRFVVGFFIPLVIITVCYTIIIVRLQNNNMARSNKPFKIMTALIVTFVISWLPYHVFTLLELNHWHNTFVTVGSRISVTLASANSCMNPFLYAFMGKDIKQKLRNSFLSIFENAFSEDRPSGSKMTSTSQALSIQ